MKTKLINKFICLSVIMMMVISATSCGAKATIPDEYNYEDLSEYIKLGEYKNLEYTKITGDVSDDEVKSYIDEKLASSEETEQIKEGTVEKDSVVNIDYVGSIDGVEFEGGAAKGVDLDIANSGYIEGFAEGIVGHKVGETFDLHVTFPENYGKEELNGKPAVFKTTINYLVKKKKAEYNDEWVKNNTDYQTKAEYEKSVKDELSEQKLSSAESNEKSEVFNQIFTSSEVIKYPEKELEARKEMINSMYANYAKSSGMELEDFISSQMGMDAEQFKKLTEQSAQEAVKQELILYSIKDKESIEVNQAGYDEFIAKQLESSGYTEESFKEANDGKTIYEYANENNMFSSYLYKVVMDKVMELSVGK